MKGILNLKSHFHFSGDMISYDPGGFRVDCSISQRDGETATDERLLKARDNIVSGATEGGKLIVLRDKERLYFELRK